MDIPVVYEDNNILVINKPFGIVVNRAESVQGKTVQDWVEKEFRIRNLELRIEQGEFYNRTGIVHRLDKETSGLLIIAKDPISFHNLQEQFKQKRIFKKYHTLVYGIVAPEKGKVIATVGRLPWNRERFGILAGGRPSETDYTVLKSFRTSLGDYSLISVIPHTGRTHQIRIHLKYLGHPVIADKFYAGRKIYKKSLIFCPRLFLHASEVKFIHPVTRSEIYLKTELPDELKEVINKLVMSSEL